METPAKAYPTLKEVEKLAYDLDERTWQWAIVHPVNVKGSVAYITVQFPAMDKRLELLPVFRASSDRNGHNLLFVDKLRGKIASAQRETFDLEDEYLHWNKILLKEKLPPVHLFSLPSEIHHKCKHLVLELDGTRWEVSDDRMGIDSCSNGKKTRIINADSEGCEKDLEFIAAARNAWDKAVEHLSKMHHAHDALLEVLNSPNVRNMSLFKGEPLEDGWEGMLRGKVLLTPGPDKKTFFDLTFDERIDWANTCLQTFQSLKPNPRLLENGDAFRMAVEKAFNYVGVKDMTFGVRRSNAFARMAVSEYAGRFKSALVDEVCDGVTTAEDAEVDALFEGLGVAAEGGQAANSLFETVKAMGKVGEYEALMAKVLPKFAGKAEATMAICTHLVHGHSPSLKWYIEEPSDDRSGVRNSECGLRTPRRERMARGFDRGLDER